ncbi:MAG: GNAT family N-acetyltransferase [bacterium]
MLKENKVNESEVTLDNLSFFDIFQIHRYLDNVEVARRAFGISGDISGLQESVSKLKKSIIFNRSSFKVIKYNKRTVGFIQIHYETYDQVKIGIVIGERKYWGRNIGSIALRKMVDLLFRQDKNLKKIRLDTASYNTIARRCFEKVGFRVYMETEDKVYMELDRPSDI